MEKRKKRVERGKAKVKGPKEKVRERRGWNAGDETQVTSRAEKWPARRKPPCIPPPECDVWPEEHRGENWKPAYAFIFEGKCQLCAHSCPLPKSRQLMDKFQGNTRLLHCTNHPAHSGRIVEVLPTDTCRNFKPKCWKLPRAKPQERPRCTTPRKAGGKIERIPLGDNLFALVDAADYKGEIGKHRWYATHRGINTYAMCFKNGRGTYMHRMIMRPRRGYIVDHGDGNGLNNCRDNLRVCTRRQNQANRRSHCGSSRFVGVYRHKDKWVAEIRSHGRYFYLGYFDGEVEAARARDRKAYELHGEFAYLNFPEDFAKRRQKVGAKRRGTSTGRRGKL
jgi:hypothetical protein